MKDGWHIIKGYRCHVENNRIIKCIKYDHNGQPIPAYPYKASKDNGWVNAIGVNVNTFRNSNYTVL